MANHDGTKLIPYKCSDKDKLTRGGKLNKPSANVAIERNAGGVHYHSDYTQSIRLGEAISIGILEEQILVITNAIKTVINHSLNLPDSMELQ